MTEERARIARELHDVVAHGVSMIVVQAQGGARMVRIEPDEAEQAFAAIERTGRQALAEMRRLLGMLRAADERAALAPQPGVERLGDLIEGVRSAGLPVDLQVEGPVDRAAARRRRLRLPHRAGGADERAQARRARARAQVRVRYLPGAVELEVSDDGAGERRRAAQPAGTD